jgi:hypothetical protein
MLSSRHAGLPDEEGIGEARAGALVSQPVPCPGVLPEGVGPLPAGERDSHAEAGTGACDGVEGAAEDEVRVI